MDPRMEDVALARRAASQDGCAWRQIYSRTRDRLFALLMYQIGDREEALDVLQETYLAAVRGIGSYRGEASLDLWLSAIALRRSRDWKRRLFRRIRPAPRRENESAIEVPDVGSDPSERHRLHQALARLPERQRAAVLLHLWQGYSFREIAVALGVGEATARVHCYRGREALRVQLKESVLETVPRQIQEQRS